MKAFVMTIVCILLVGTGCVMPADNRKNPNQICTTVSVPGIIAHLQDSQGAAISNAEVKITEADYEDNLLQGFLADGSYVGAYERPGIYTLLVTAPGFQDQQITNLIVPDDESGCHVLTNELNLVMVP